MLRALLFVALASFFFWTGCATERAPLPIASPYRQPMTLKKGQILHIATGQLLSKSELIDYLAHLPVVYVGESHDSVDDHAVELEILKGLVARFPGRVTLGLEMLRRPSQADVDAYIRGHMTEKEFFRVWQKNWGNSFRYYRDILRYARQERMPILALNAGRDLITAVQQKGLDGLDPAMTSRLPEMDLDDPYHRALIASIYAEHTKVSKHLEVFYRIQVLWDETMAQTAATYLASPEGQDTHLVIFAGDYHVRYGLGIPRRLFRRVPLPYVIVEPFTVEVPQRKQETLMHVELPDLPLRPADIYWAVGYEDLEQQRVHLGVHVEQVEGGGARVLKVLPDSPAAAAGIAMGDIIVALDGVRIDEIVDLTYEVGLHQPGDKGELEVSRNGQRLALKVTYGAVHPKP